MTAIGQVVGALIESGAYRATKFLSERQIVRATRRHKIDRRNKREEFVLTLGAPNHAERKFILACRRAKEPFPVRKVKLKFLPKARS